MSGFFRVAFEGEYFNQKIVNVFHYRSAGWVTGQGNPFVDTLGALDDIIAELMTTYRACLSNNHTVVRATGVGYDDAYAIVTPSPLERQVNLAGTNGAGETNGASPCAIIGLRCGEQHQINLIAKSKRNRGYLAIGPTHDAAVDNYQHLTAGMMTVLDAFAQHVDNQIVGVNLLQTLVPIRIHTVYTYPLGVKTFIGRTYSDVLGYAVRRVTSVRRSRFPEA